MRFSMNHLRLLLIFLYGDVFGLLLKSYFSSPDVWTWHLAAFTALFTLLFMHVDEILK